MYCQQCKLDIQGETLDKCPLCESPLLDDTSGKKSASEASPPEKGELKEDVFQ